ncbi:MAG: hypothetical protein ACPH56_13045, partial [Spongiibacter marinus]|uniref:hypothetical protein n=1 Tax=Spongiibacter marinus TaxID=354246 RepID=UPI003C6A3708
GSTKTLIGVWFSQLRFRKENIARRVLVLSLSRFTLSCAMSVTGVPADEKLQARKDHSSKVATSQRGRLSDPMPTVLWPPY